jgi:hypothetical protein
MLKMSRFVPATNIQKNNYHGGYTVLFPYSYICTARKSHGIECLSLFVLTILAGFLFLSNIPLCISSFKNSDK